MSTNLIKEENLIKKSLEYLTSGEFNFLKQNVKLIKNILLNEESYNYLKLNIENYKLDSLMAFSYFYLKEYDKSYNVIEDTIITIDITDNTNNSISCGVYKSILLNILIKIYISNKDYDSFEQTINYISQHHVEHNNIERISNLYKDIINLLVSNYVSQTDLINLFLNYVNSNVDSFDFDLNSLGVIYNCIGICYSDIFANTRRAIEYFAKSLNISILNNDISSELTARNALAVEYLMLGDYDKALEILNMLLNEDRYSSKIDSRLKSILYINMIEIHLRLHNTTPLENILNNLEKALTTVEDPFYKQLIHENFIVLKSEYLNEINKPDDSLKLLHDYEIYIQQSSNEISLSNDAKCSMLINYGFANLLKKNYEVAINYFIEAYGIQENINLTMTHLDSLEFLYKTYKEIDDFENACVCLEDIVNKLKEKNKQIFKNNLEYIYEKFELQEKNNKIKELQQMNYLDGLTNISNRKFIDSNLPIEINNSTITKPLSILMLDIDYFKHYNDTYGHLKGDEILIRVSSELSSLCKKNNYSVSRYGGEEFLIICSQTDEIELEYFATGIKNHFKELKIEHKSSSVSPFLTISMGGTTIYSQTDKNDLISYADMALYYSKANGRNKFTHASRINTNEM